MIGAYGGFFIPKSFGTSIAMTGGADAALYMFIVFYITCVATTWWFYSRKGAEHPAEAFFVGAGHARYEWVGRMAPS